MKRTIFAIAFLFSSLAIGAAQTPRDLASRAEQAYTQSNYLQAIQNWMELQSLGFVNANLYNNVGTAYWRLGRVGEALRYFILAKRLAPRDAEIRANLRLIENKLGGAVKTEKFPLDKLELNYSESLLASSLLAILLFTGLIFWRLKQNKLYRLLALLLILPFTWTCIQLIANFKQHFWSRQAVIISPKAMLQEAPVLSAAAKQNLPEGTVVTVVKDQGSFAYVEVLGGSRGWIARSTLGEI